MRLLHSETLLPHEFPDDRQRPAYAALSHTWGLQEISFEDIIKQPLATRKIGESKGVDKILQCAKEAKIYGLEYIWIDTCCIQKTSSAELSEAINSMFNWYKDATVCYAFLADVPPRRHKSPQYRNALPEEKWQPAFRRSRWFTRGWTLQELIAPRNFVFYSNQWTPVGTKLELAKTVSSITGIPKAVLIEGDVFGQSVACRMSWAANRQTSRVEDLAYCLLGIFDITMPLLYGEGRNAFQRLQQEIVKVTDDETIFAWKASSSTLATWRSLFALHPSEFESSGNLIPLRRNKSTLHETTMNKGLRIQLPLVRRRNEEHGWDSGTEYVAILSCHVDTITSSLPIGIFVKRVQEDEFVRVDVDKYTTTSETDGLEPVHEQAMVSVRQRLDYAPWIRCVTCFRVRGMWIKNLSSGVLLSDVRGDGDWNGKNNMVTFRENDLRIGKTQRVTCVFSTGRNQSSVEFYFSPQEVYEDGCCKYTPGSKNSFHAYYVRSFIRVIDHEAVLVVNVEVF